MIPAMNRQQRRMMEKQQARVRATRRPDRPARLPMLIKTQQTLAPLESIIDQIERDGTVTVDARGLPIFHCVADGEWYASAPAILGMADFFDMWATRHGREFKAAALRQLAKRLEVGMPVDAPLLTALHAEIPTLRRIGAGLDQNEATDLLQQTRNLAELDATRATGADMTPIPAGWKPIESAPKDGTPVLLFARHIDAEASTRVVGWFNADYGWIAQSYIGQPFARLIPSQWAELLPFPGSPASVAPGDAQDKGALMALADRIEAASEQPIPISIEAARLIREAVTRAPAAGNAQTAAAPEWMACESRRPWVTNCLKAHAQELRNKEKRCRRAFNKDFMGVPSRYVADAYADAAAVFEAKLAAIDAINAGKQQGEA